MKQVDLNLSPKISDEVRKTTCYMCACRCGIDVHFKDGKLTYIEGNKDHPVNKGVLCAKGSAGIMQIKAPSRLRAPLKRVGPRGSGEFKEITWEEALSTATEWLSPLRKEAPEVVERMGYEEGGEIDNQMLMVMSPPMESEMESDDDMEDNYTRFIMEEALSEEEEDMLTSKLEQDEELSMLFDKIIDVAQEFAGSGPVEGPGSGVSDSIPARLSDGEFVFTAKAVEEIGEDSLMSMMKEAEAAADERQGLAMGGPTDEVEKPNTNVQGMLMSDATGVAEDLRERAISGDKRYIQS